MPAEAVLSTHEKYELKDTKPKEDIVHREEIGIWNKALMEWNTDMIFFYFALL